MATQGSIAQINFDREIWTAYTESLEEYFLANDVESAEKQRAVYYVECAQLQHTA